jgi:hypothetical protein
MLATVSAKAETTEHLSVGAARFAPDLGREPRCPWRMRVLFVADELGCRLPALYVRAFDCRQLSTVTAVFRCSGSRIVQKLDWLIVLALTNPPSAFGTVRVFATNIG